MTLIACMMFMTLYAWAWSLFGRTWIGSYQNKNCNETSTQKARDTGVGLLYFNES